MQREKNIGRLMPILAASVAGLLLAGCELESANYRIDITPSAATVNKGESITLTAHGGYNYEWSLQAETWATLSSRTGNLVVYTSLYEPVDTPAVQIVTVVSTFSNSGSGGSTNSTESHSGEAYITHLPAPATSNTAAQIGM